MILNLSKKTKEVYFSCYDVLLDKNQAVEIADCIKWKKDKEGYAFTKNDTLSKKEVNRIMEKNSNLEFLLTHITEVEQGCTQGFYLKDFIKNKAILPQKGAATGKFMQVNPIDNRPTFQYIGSKCVWFQELGLYKILSTNGGFYNPINNCLCF